MSFLRPDLLTLKAYVPQPGGESETPVDILDTNESPYDLPAPIKQILAQQYQQQIETNRYPDGSHKPLKAAIANYVIESANLAPGVITPQHISVSNGSDELIRSILIATCLGRESSILVANPTFSMYDILAQAFMTPVVAIERNLDDFSINLEAAQQAITQTQSPPVRVIFMVHPNSPTGQCLTEAEIDWLRSVPTDILVVIDEAYFEFSQQSLVAELPNHPNWLITRTFSKAYRLAALRVGYAIASPQVITALEKIRLPYNLSTVSQNAALLALENRHTLLEAISKIQKEVQRMTEALAAIPELKVWPSDANFIYARLRPESKPQDEQLSTLVQTLKSQGTLIRHTGDGLRITVGTPEENDRTLTRISQFIATLN